jgi:hypothetical protein
MIYCSNKECVYYRALEKPIHFIFSKYSEPFPDDVVKGKCTITPKFSFEYFIDSTTKCEQPVCNQIKGNCGALWCLHNDTGDCARKEILVDESLISHKLICKCISNRKIKGHRDWFQNLKSDGTSKGGHLSDQEARKIKPLRKD